MSSPWMRLLPNGKAISSLGFGCSSLWAKPGFDEERAQAVLKTAVDGGLNYFDTSPSYGGGCAERRLGYFLANQPIERLILSTKVGNNLIDGQVQRGFTYDLMRQGFEASLARLGVDRVDLLFLHGPAIGELHSDDVARFFKDEKAAGRISYSGVESRSTEVITSALECSIDAVMPHFNIENRSLDGAISKLHAAGKIVISGTTLAQMKFAPKTFLPTNRNALWYLLRMAKNDPLFWWHGPALARRLRAQGQTPRETAIEFVTNHPHVTSGLFGSSNPEHVAANVRTARKSSNSPLDGG